MSWLGKDKELDAHRDRRLNALIERIEEPTITMEVVHPATRLKELDRIYRDLETHFDSRVLVLDKLQGNGDRGPRGTYYFPTVMHAVTGIRSMRENIIAKNAEIAEEEEKIRRIESAKNYTQETELEINGICAAYSVEGLQTL